MRGLQNALLFLMTTGSSGLFAYELAAHSGDLFDLHLPGWNEARCAERAVEFTTWTRIPPLDHLVHEGQEAVVYYSILLR